MKYKLTKHAIDAIAIRGIKEEWIEMALNYPTYHRIVCDDEEHFFKTIDENLDKCLKVVINPIELKIVTAYFDRNMRKKGCKNENQV